MKSDKTLVLNTIIVMMFIGIAIAMLTSFSGVGTPLEGKQFIQANNTFAFDLYSDLAQQPGNLVISPFSIDMALTMTRAGARGETARQMEEALHLSSGAGDPHAGFAALLKELNDTNASRCQLVVANALWAQKGFPFKSSFRKIVQTQYGGYLSEADFSTSADVARRQINTWVATQTHDRILQIIGPELIRSETDLVLANAVYFKGGWLHSFDKLQTRDLSFQLGTGESVSVPTMEAAHMFRYAETATLQLLEIAYADSAGLEEMPYKSNHFSMVILLPKKVDALSQLVRTLTVTEIERLLNESRVTEVVVFLPRFKIGSNFDLNEKLRAMGMIDAFSEKRADFSGISAVKPLFIDFVSHGAWVDVDEKGTEATAATALALTHGSHMDAPVFNANHPFLFLIRHNPTGIILFLGRLSDPSK